MKRAIFGSMVLAALAVAGALAYQAAAQDREYRRLVLQGDGALGQGQTFVAIEAFSGAIALKPDSMLAFLRRGEAYRRRGDLTAALRDLRTASRLDPGATRPLEQLGDVNYALRRYARAAESYEAYLRLDDRSPSVLYRLALASRQNGHLSRAVAALVTAVKLNERFAEAHYLLGVCLVEAHRTDEALAELVRAVTISPALIPAREELADLHALRGRRREEIEQLEALAALDPGRPERLIAVGLAYSRGNSPDQAVMALGRAAERFPDQPEVYAALGRVWLRAAEEHGDKASLRKALEALEPVASQPSATSDVLALYGRALSLNGETEKAEQVLQQASARLPAEPTALLALANVARRLGHYAQARDALIRYTMLSDDDGDRGGRAAQIGDLSMQLNDPDVAVRWFQRAADAAGQDAALLGRLADAQFRAGRLDEARSTLDKAIEKDPGSAFLRSLARRLD
ncbi:MAG: tetratricopeptide repeat protein [Candidatus Krumholzibacteria bacterium]|nr:tetratricopeptide repeat protein [Candidatus Krumholzibacteria bacterium]